MEMISIIGYCLQVTSLLCPNSFSPNQADLFQISAKSFVYCSNAKYVMTEKITGKASA
jgi:hypothetical protein